MPKSAYVNTFAHGKMTLFMILSTLTDCRFLTHVGPLSTTSSICTVTSTNNPYELYNRTLIGRLTTNQHLHSLHLYTIAKATQTVNLSFEDFSSSS